MTSFSRTTNLTHNSYRLFSTAASYLALILLALVFLAPFLWMVSTSLKEESRVFSEAVEWIPRPVVWTNYRDAVSALMPPFAAE